MDMFTRAPATSPSPTPLPVVAPGIGVPFAVNAERPLPERSECAHAGPMGTTRHEPTTPSVAEPLTDDDL